MPAYTSRAVDQCPFQEIRDAQVLPSSRARRHRCNCSRAGAATFHRVLAGNRQGRRIVHGVSDHRSGRRRLPAIEARQGSRHGRHLRNGWRLQEVLPWRDRLLERVASDPGPRDGGVPQGRRAVHRTACRLRRTDRRDQPEERLAQVDHRCRTPQDVGAGGSGQGHEVEADQRRVARCDAEALRRRIRLGNVRLLHRSRQRSRQGEPR